MCIYCLEGAKWNSTVITWSFASAGGSVTNSIDGAYQDVVKAAIAKWGSVTNLTFKQVADSSATDIRIGWGSFNGSQVGQTDYAYQTSSTGASTFTSGVTVRLEDPSLKAVGTAMNSTYAGTSTTLYETALHELGHALGLAHCTDGSAVMNATLGSANNDLGATDIAGIQALYGAASAAATATVAAVTAAAVLPPAITLPAGEVAVYRFFDKSTGTQFLTGDTTERNTLIQTRSDLSYEGLGMSGIASNSSDPNAAPVFRFFDTKTGTHLFTTDSNEVATIKATRSDLIQEQSSFSEHLTQQAGDTPVFRFFEKTDGTHFFTADNSERASIAATRPDMVYEGVAFYVPSTNT